MTDQDKCPTSSPTCQCNQMTQTNDDVPAAVLKTKSKNTFKAIGSTFLSLIIAFFPKCPICWAAYLSMFGSFGLSNVPYISWLYPVLVGFLVLHLYLIFKKVKEKGYWPFILSVTGASVILSTRLFQTDNKQVLIVGMLFILIGSLWNNFTFNSYKMSV